MFLNRQYKSSITVCLPGLAGLPSCDLLLVKAAAPNLLQVNCCKQLLAMAATHSPCR
jgi:hypothetical protein